MSKAMKLFYRMVQLMLEDESCDYREEVDFYFSRLSLEEQDFLRTVIDPEVANVLF